MTPAELRQRVAELEKEVQRLTSLCGDLSQRVSIIRIEPDAAHDAEVRAEERKALFAFLDDQCGTFDGYKWDDGAGHCGFDNAIHKVREFVEAREAEEKAK